MSRREERVIQQFVGVIHNHSICSLWSVGLLLYSSFGPCCVGGGLGQLQTWRLCGHLSCTRPKPALPMPLPSLVPPSSDHSPCCQPCCVWRNVPAPLASCFQELFRLDDMRGKWTVIFSREIVSHRSSSRVQMPSLPTPPPPKSSLQLSPHRLKCTFLVLRTSALPAS